MNEYAYTNTCDSEVGEPTYSEVKDILLLQIEIKIQQCKQRQKGLIKQKVTNNQIDKFQWRVKMRKRDINLLCKSMYKSGKY